MIARLEETFVRTEELDAVNAELAELLHREPADTVSGSRESLSDELILCGILGGKDVGKSTLINALTQARVSVDEDEVSEGTQRPTAFVHEEMRAQLAARLQRRDGFLAFDVALHSANALRSLVLVDLPDFDSDFDEHLRIVESIAPLLDRVIWLTTPRKIADRAWVAMLRRVLKDDRNAFCVLNKFDELLADAEPFESTKNERPQTISDRAESFWRSQSEWFDQSLRSAGFEPHGGRCFFLAAAFPDQASFMRRIGELWNDPDWSRYSKDCAVVQELGRRTTAEIERLRQNILNPITSDQALTIKRSNYAVEQRVNTETIRSHYKLDSLLIQLQQACEPEYHRRLFEEHFGTPFCQAAAAALQTQMRSDRELADELLERRIDHWPLLRLVHWPFGWLSRVVGRQIAPKNIRKSTQPLGDPLEIDGRSLRERIAGLRSRLLCDFAGVVDRLEIEPRLPTPAILAELVAADSRSLVPELEKRLLDAAWPRERKPSILARAATWFILLWFPIIQPLALAATQLWSSKGTLDLASGFYHVLIALSATHLLASLGLVAGIYVAILSALYVSGLRKLQRLRGATDDPSTIGSAIAELINHRVIAATAKPLEEALERLKALNERLRSWRLRG